MQVTDLREAILKAYDWPGYSTIPAVRERILARLSEAKDSILAFLCAPLACTCPDPVMNTNYYGLNPHKPDCSHYTRV